MAESDAQFLTAFNYQKLAVNSSRTDAVAVGTTNLSISHDLGYIPSIRVWFDPELGIRAPVSTWQITELNSVGVRAYLTTTTLEIQIANPATPKNITTWYRIYYDR
jgi:hypothetical protein